MIRSIVRAVVGSPVGSLLAKAASLIKRLLKLPLSAYTFTRSDSSKLVEDYRGVLVSTDVNIPAFKGARLAKTVADGAELGSVNLWDDPTFDGSWTLDADASIVDGVLIATSDGVSFKSTTLPTAQLLALRVTATGDAPEIRLGSSGDYTQSVSGEWVDMPAASGSAFMYVYWPTGTSGSVTNVEVVERTPTNLATDTLGNALLNKADYSTARPVSGAVTEGSTYYEDGRMLGGDIVTNGGFDTDTDWNKGIGWTISGGKAVASSASSYLDQPATAINSSVGVVSFDLTVDSGSINIPKTGGGWYSYSTTQTVYALIDINADYPRLYGASFTGTVDNYKWYPAYTRPIALTCTTGGTTGATLDLDETDIGTTVTDNTAQFEVKGYPTIEGYDNDPQLTNKCTSYKYNPVDLTGLTKSGDAAATLTIVDDSAELAAAGLSEICTDGNVFKLDNSGGSAIAYAYTGSTGNTNPHSLLSYLRGTGNYSYGDSWGSAREWITSQAAPTVYTQVTAQGVTPVNSGTAPCVTAEPGAVIYFILPTLVEAAAIDAPIINHGGDAAATVDLPADNLSFEAPSNLTAQKGAVELVVTPSASGQPLSYPINMYVDANTELSVVLVATLGVLRKRIGGSNVDTDSAVYSHSKGTPMRIQAYWGNSGMGLRIADASSDITAVAFATSVDTSDVTLAPVLIGHRNGSSHFAGEYITCNTYGSKEEAGW